ncbi:MAG: right-handed parallel beta-helix repeat-containing protein [Alphaproteobacteria bacterium]|nr:right-handed parallel beta-helix repeat-containing protein [Alphaproteobacteria bacterium]
MAMLCCLAPQVLAAGRTLEVGPTRPLRLPSEAARLAGDGDRVLIDPGIYRDCAYWPQNDLVLRARDGEVHLTEKVCGGKAIWVIAGRDVVVEGIRFSQARVPDRNGAGIRLEPEASLTVRHSHFLGNEIGLLAGNGARSYVVIEHSRFEETTLSHALYVNFIDRLEIRNSVFLRQFGKHHVKSRARLNLLVDNTIDDGTDGVSSYLVDFPNGGTITLQGNRLTKGPRSANATAAIAIGLEGEKLQSEGIMLRDNEFTSRRPGLRAFVRNATGVEAQISGNRIRGFVTVLSGPGTVTPGPRRTSNGTDGRKNVVGQ